MLQIMSFLPSHLHLEILYSNVSLPVVSVSTFDEQIIESSKTDSFLNHETNLTDEVVLVTNQFPSAADGA